MSSLDEDQDRTKTWRWLFPLIAVVVLAFFPLVSAVSNGFSESGIQVNQPEEIYGQNSDDFTKGTVAFYIQMLEFDPETERAKLMFYPWPTDDLADQFSSSVISKKEIQVFVDSQNTSVSTYGPGQQIGGIEAQLDVLSTYFPELASDSLYPFDKYVLDAYASAKVKWNEGEDFSPVQTFDYFYQSPVSGFEVTYQRLGAFENLDPSAAESQASETIEFERADGNISFYAFFERSFAVKAIAIFIYTFIVLATIVLAWVTQRIASGARPASMNALIWAAASILGILDLRAVAPGEPRVGVFGDLMFFFPPLFLSLACTVVLAYFWTVRKSWQD